MRVAEVIGNVTLSPCHPSLVGATWLIAVPLSASGLAGKQDGRGESLVLLDEQRAGHGTGQCSHIPRGHLLVQQIVGLVLLHRHTVVQRTAGE